MHKLQFFGIYMKPTAHNGTKALALTTTERYDDNGKGCIIFIVNIVDMPQPYIAATLRD